MHVFCVFEILFLLSVLGLVMCWTAIEPTSLPTTLFSTVRSIASFHLMPGDLFITIVLLAILGVDRLIFKPVCIIGVGITLLLLTNSLL